MNETTWLGGKVTARKMKPTKKHKAAIWEGMLAAVYAMNENSCVEYFDWDWEGALEFAGYTGEPDQDARLARYDGSRGYQFPDVYGSSPHKGQFVLWLVREPTGDDDCWDTAMRGNPRNRRE